jgi:hypothetical protein
VTTVVVSAYNVANFPQGGGHFWVYMQYVKGLQRLGCEVYWLEALRGSGDPRCDADTVTTFTRRMERFGLSGKLIIYRDPNGEDKADLREYLGMCSADAEAVFRRADLLLNFHYGMDPALLSCFRRTALVDIDPGLLQFWISRGQIAVARHDRYFTTGETVGTPAARFPDCGLSWLRIRPPVCLDLWPYISEPGTEAFRTVSSWWGVDWLVDGDEVIENTKRVSFLRYAELPRLTPQVLELALFLIDTDARERQFMEAQGWRIRHSSLVAGNPETYQAYIQGSRGEFSCAKPSCMLFENAWVSDRTLCYLASGRPVVVQNTGPSAWLPDGLGMFRFSTMAEAVDAIAAINADYERHRRAARELAESYFDAQQICERILNLATRPAL